MFYQISKSPNLQTILQLFKEIEINAQCVPTLLGGGQLGYVGLVLTEDIYNQIPSAESVICPTYPDLLQVQDSRQTSCANAASKKSQLT